MTKHFLDTTYTYITNRLFDKYPDLRRNLRYFELPEQVESCLGILDKWDQNKVLNLLYKFSITLPDNTPVDVVADKIADKFIVIMSWDELVNSLASAPMKFAFGPHKEVWLHTCKVETDIPPKLILTFCDVHGGPSPQDLVQATLTLNSTGDDLNRSWKDLGIWLQVKNLATQAVRTDIMTMKTFRFTRLAKLINEVYY